MGSITTREPTLPVVGKLYTYAEAAQTLRLREQTLRLWASEGKLTTIKLGLRSVRIPESALRDLIAEGFVPGSRSW